MRVHDNGTLGHLHFGAPLDPDRSHAHLGPTGFAGFKNRVGDPVPLEYPTTGSGDYRIPALTVELADGSTRPRSRLPRAPDPPRQTGTAGGRRPAGDLRRVRRRGRHARGRPRRRPERPAGRAQLHDLPRRAGHRPQRPDPQRRHRTRPPDRRDERRPRPARCALGVRPAERRLGSREPRRDPSPAPGPPVGRQRPRRLEPPCTTRSSPCAGHDHDRGRGRGLRLQPRLLGQLPRRGRGRCVRHDQGPARDQPEHVHLDPRAGRDLRDPRGRARLLGRRARGHERRPPRPLPRTPGARLVARPAPAGPHQQLGGDLLRLRRGEAARDRDRRARPRRRAVRAR